MLFCSVAILTINVLCCVCSSVIAPVALHDTASPRVTLTRRRNDINIHFVKSLCSIRLLARIGSVCRMWPASMRTWGCGSHEGWDRVTTTLYVLHTCIEKPPLGSGGKIRRLQCFTLVPLSMHLLLYLLLVDERSKLTKCLCGCVGGLYAPVLIYFHRTCTCNVLKVLVSAYECI